MQGVAPGQRRHGAKLAQACVKHGLTARLIVIGDEDPDAFEALRADLEADWQPSIRLEQELVERLAVLLWRLRRVPTLEAALVKARQAEARSRLEREQDGEHLDRLNNEVRRRFEDSCGNDDEEISRATFHRSYAARIARLREQVEAEWNEAGFTTARDEEELPESDAGAVLLDLITDPEDAGALAKLTRLKPT